MATKILTNDKRRTLTNDKLTTLSRAYVCDNCGEPAMTDEGGALRCPSCWLADQTKKVNNRIDRGGYYP